MYHGCEVCTLSFLGLEPTVDAKSTLVTQMSLGEELVLPDRVQNLVSADSCGAEKYGNMRRGGCTINIEGSTKKKLWSTSVEVTGH